MTIEKKIPFFYLLLLIFQITSTATATHIVGGDISVQYTGTGNDFEITVNFYWDCTGTDDNNFASAITIGLYKANNTPVNQYLMQISGSPRKLALGDSCLAFDGCIKAATYKRTVTIPNDPGGYYVSFQQNIRSTDIDNIVISPPEPGAAVYTDIPNPALHNSSPVFNSFENGYMCVNKVNTRSFKCTDPDGDSLVYFLETPLDSKDKNSNPGPSPKPFPPVTWVSVPSTPYYNESNMIGGATPMTINPETGEVTSNPDRIGVFVFAVRVDEYDRATKTKLGEIRRDVQYSVVLCDNLPPQFTSPTESSFEITAGDSLCFNLKLEDGNLKDSVYFSAVSDLFNVVSGQPKVVFSPRRGMKTIDTLFCLYTFCGNEREKPYSVVFNGNDTSCYNNGFISKTVEFYVYSSDKGYVQGFLPNVFTPNGDGINDSLKVNDAIKNCYDTFDVKIYDRWGAKVYESGDFYFLWDGRHYKSGKELPQGVYHYAVKSRFGDNTTERNGYVTLLK